METKQKIVKAILILLAIMIIVLVGYGAYASRNKNKADNPKNETENKEEIKNRSEIETKVINFLVKNGMKEKDLVYKGVEDNKHKVLNKKESNKGQEMYHYVDLENNTFKTIGIIHMGAKK